jgi:hypothetical protein
MTDTSRPDGPPVYETLERFRGEAEAGRAVLHPECDYCGLPVDPDEARSGFGFDALHDQCWYEHAGIGDRIEWHRSGGARGTLIASEAAREEDPEAFLLDVIGDPARSYHDRIDAEQILEGNVSTRTLVESWFRCPNCREGEQFPMDPEGSITCHCGEVLREADA